MTRKERRYMRGWKRNGEEINDLKVTKEQEEEDGKMSTVYTPD